MRDSKSPYQSLLSLPAEAGIVKSPGERRSQLSNGRGRSVRVANIHQKPATINLTKNGLFKAKLTIPTARAVQKTKFSASASHHQKSIFQHIFQNGLQKLKSSLKLLHNNFFPITPLRFLVTIVKYVTFFNLIISL